MAFYGIAPDGGLSRPVTVETAGVGVGGGYFGLARVLVVPGGQDACVYASNAQSGDIVSMPAGQRKLAGNFRGSPADTVPAPNGIGLAVSARYLYASFAGSGNIGTFEIQPGCKLRFLGDVHVKGLHGGQVECMAVHADIMVAAYGDGSIESFHVGGGPPGSNHDAQDATGYRDDHRPGAVDITQDGRYAIFGDASTVTTVEVSDMSAGKLAPTVVYNLGPAWNSGGVRLSPDESVLYVSNSSGGRVTAAFFDKTTGKLRSGCTSLPLKGFPAQFAYAGGVATQLATGTGGLLYVPEFATGRQSYIGMLRFAAAQDGCTLTETADSPVAGTHISALLSIAVYPPRPF
jgi:DNA-binding beta-propeller fold protein YncE